MSEHDGLSGDGKQLQLVDDKNGASENKLASFGHSLFQHGKDLVNGVQKQVEHVDVKGLAAQAQEKLSHADLGNMANQAGRILGDNKGGLAGIAGAAVGLGFPQLALIDKGSSALGDVLAHKQARALLDDPKKLSDKLLTSFDEFDRDKTGYLTDAKLRQFDGITGIGNDNRAVAQILRSGFTTFNSLDGDASKKGISRKDVEVLGLMQDKDLLNQNIKKTAFDHCLPYAAAGAGAGAAAAYIAQSGMDFSVAALKSTPVGKLAAAAAIGALAAGGIADVLSRHNQHNFYDERSKDVDRMLKAMKNSF
jgi:hypothetical protein